MPPDVPTHSTGNVIDLGFCSPSLFMSIDATVDPSLCVGSDHLPIHYVLNFDVVRSISTRFNAAKMELVQLYGCHAKWKAASSKPADSDEGDTDDEELPTLGTRRPTKIFPRSLDLLFGGVVRRAVGKPPPAQFTREVLMMELLAAEESDEEPDDGALPGSEDEYTP
ncbi:hypothetical protein B0H10DRAFT_2227667 [Mycena sp. CBHHK59/15]|nr:hypothetical protein B0H10DRAFT_2227667 [Mycena sp. CBHHK59/15]